MRLYLQQYILAAGLSTRFGSNKSLALLEDSPLIVRAIRTSLPNHPLVLVVGHEREALEKCLTANQIFRISSSKWQCSQTKICFNIVENSNYRLGMATSVTVALSNALKTLPASKEDCWVLLTTVDLPLLSTKDLMDYTFAIKNHKYIDHVQAYYGSSYGIPTAISHKVIEEFINANSNKKIALKKYLETRQDSGIFLEKPHLKFDLDYRYQYRFFTGFSKAIQNLTQNPRQKREKFLNKKNTQ